MSRDTSIERQVALKAAVELVKAILEADKALPGGGKDAILVAVRAADEFAKWISAGQGFVSPDRVSREGVSEVQPADRPEGGAGKGKAGTPSGHQHQWMRKDDKWDVCMRCGRARKAKAA